jgi:hypothetical protein
VHTVTAIIALTESPRITTRRSASPRSARKTWWAVHAEQLSKYNGGDDHDRHEDKQTRLLKGHATVRDQERV